jgi:deoxyribonuclease-4
MSIAGGMERSVERAVRVEATALQVFVKSSNQWAARPFAPGESEAFRAALADAGLQDHTLAHTAYLINLASPDDALWNRSLEALKVEIERCGALGIPFLVLHPGSHVGSGEEAGLKRVARALDGALLPTRGRGSTRGDSGVTVLLETTAGQGSNLGSRFEHLAWILENARSTERLGVCLDTCHVLAAGYEIRTARGYRQTFREFDEVIGLERLRGLHLNDSKTDLGSRKDRHEHIGRGHLGTEPFRLLLNDRRFRDLPMVLETPKGEDLAEDRENLSLLRSLVQR